MKIKKNNGITLIALVITIIVLIILAGISINLLMGDNGIIKKAQSAGDTSKQAQIKEEIALKCSDAKMQYIFEKSQNSKKDLYNCLEEAGLDIINYNNNAYIVKYEKDGKTYLYNVNDSGEISLIGDSNNEEKNAIAAAISSENYYGKTVNYSANGITDWKIFYSNGTNLFLIASDYLPNSKVPDAAQLNKSGTYNVSWNYVGTQYDSNNRQDGLFMATRYTLNDDWANSRAVTRLLNTGTWSGFVNSTYADYAIGSPTIEMIISSINEKYPNENQLAVEPAVTGYWIYAPTANNSNTPGIGWVKLSNYDGDGDPTQAGINHAAYGDGTNVDSLYFPHTSSVSGCNGIWIASPCAYYRGYVMRMSYGGMISSYACDESVFGLRPVVALKSNVKLEEGTNGYDFNLSLN